MDRARSTTAGRLARWAALLIWMLLVAWLSTDAGGSSHTRSWIADLLSRVAPGLAGGAFEAVLESVDYTVRKAAHLSEYGMLAWLALRAVVGCARDATRRAVAWALGLSVFWAIADEIHQLYVPGRTGCVKDVLFDTVGSALGLAIAISLARRSAARAGNGAPRS